MPNKRPFHLFLALLLLSAALPLAAQMARPSPPAVNSQSYILIDANSGRVLGEKEPDARMEPASLTKMMTSYVVFNELRRGHIQLSDMVTISERAWRTGGSRMFVEVDTRVSVDHLLHGLIIQSGNDASVALAEYIAGSEQPFADLMNQFAKRLGMTGTHFTNASGLPHPEQYTTARDMARLAQALVQDFPEYYPMHAIKEFVYNDITQHNRNRLLWRDDSVDGLKTGHTSSAGYCLVVSARRDDMRLVAAMLGADSEAARTSDAQSLLNYGFRFFESRRVYGSRQPVTETRVWQGERQMLPVGTAADLWVTVPRGQYDRLQAVMEIDSQIVAPVTAGERKGAVRIMLGEEVLAEAPLLALEDVGQGNLWQRAQDYVRMFFE